MAVIYTVRLAEASSLTSGAHDLFTVISGVTVVVRDIAVFAQGASPNSCYIARDGGAALASFIGLDEYESGHWEGRGAYNPGETIQIGVLSGEFTVTITGYQLTA